MDGKFNSKASTYGALWWHLMCGLGIPIAFWVAPDLYSIDLVSSSDRMLLIFWVIQSPIVILLSSFFRINPGDCSYLKAVGRGFLGLFAGALVLALGAISLGAPVGSKYMSSTINWSLLMSSFTFSPAAAIFGASLVDWQRIFATTRVIICELWKLDMGSVWPTGYVDYMVCLPAHGAILGSWFGAWPMPLDWERAWQEWPICVTYGALVGYMIGMVASFLVVFSNRWRQYIKLE